MRKVILYLLAAMTFVACTQNSVDEVGVPQASTPDHITVGFADQTRIELNEEGKTVWTAGDFASVFYRSNANQKWEYQGETGERTGTLSRVAVGQKTADISRVVVVYPYNESYYINPETCDVEAILPATQTYRENSYGVGSNLMISSGYYNQFSLKNVLGWLKIQLKGEGQVVKSIALRGNNGEQVAGQLYVNSSDATSILASEMGIADDDENGTGGGLVFDDTILTEVTLNCPEGVTLEYLTATSFYIALPPQTFSNGITMTITYDDESIITKSTSNSITIERNTIQPMAELFYDGNDVPVYQLLYKTSDNQPLAPKGEALDGVNIISNAYDPGTDYISMKFDGRLDRIPTYFLESYSTLTSVIIPDCVTTIGGSAFTYCGNLTDITLSRNLTTIESGAFSCGCSRTITIPKSVTSIGATAFSNVDNTIYYEGSLEEWGQISFGSDDATGKSFRLYTTETSGVTEVAGDITLTTTTIGNNFLCGCSQITGITIPEGTKVIGENAFTNCTNLRRVSLPTTLESIADYSFRWCSALERINIPASVTTIGYDAIKGCSNIKRVDITDLSAWCKIDSNYFLLSYEGVGLYLNDTLLEQITIPEDIEVVRRNIFTGYSRLTSVIIPETVTAIDYTAFYGCTNLKSVVCCATTPPSLSYRAFENNAPGRKIYVLDYNSVSSYKTNWSDYASDIEFAGITYTGTSKVEPSDWAISNTTFGTSLVRNDFDEMTGTGAFSFSQLIDKIPSYTFCEVSELTQVTLPSTITEIGQQAFDRTSLTSINLPEGLTHIGELAFSQCLFESITLPESLQELYSSFSHCSNLNNVIVPSGVFMEGDVFSYCTSLTNITLNEGIQYIDIGAFRGCSSLEQITIPSTVTELGESCFYDCTSLKRVFCKPTTPPRSGGSNQFGNTHEDIVIYVPQESYEAYVNETDYWLHWSEYADIIQGYQF